MTVKDMISTGLKKAKINSIVQCSLVCLLVFLSFNSSAQRKVRDSVIATPWISVEYGINWTSGDLAKRHGLMNQIGMFAGYKTKRNWVLGAEGNFMFGNDIRATGLFDHLVDSYGNITDMNGDIALVRVASRGFHVNAIVGKVIPVLSPNKNSGIYVNVGLGYLAHKFRIETQDHVVPQIELDYRKGYDRLTSGVNTSQFIGYSFMANQGVLNFYAGFYAQQGFTYNRREVFFDQQGVDVPSEMMLDLQYGFKVAWLIPVYKRMPKDYYFD
jgi:hypothetical protein